jgi:hypothetical protein
VFRAILGVIAGYIAIAVAVFALFSVAYLSLGAERAFRPGVYEVSGLWLGVSLVLGLVAAVVGGLVCAGIARPRSRAPIALAVLVVVLGAAQAALVMSTEDARPLERAADVGNLQAMSNARTPPVALLVNPVIGAVGVLIGARLAGKRAPAGRAPR